ncbi:hypothetical protein ACFSUS_03520 [Spirosoma soli]|uniref:Addiction module protein n=1 Tax=Spirosoma soli TaxID=1770529 RepID=A0ABW5LZH4_9BACT
MSTIELRSNLHRLIDQIDDDAVLEAHLTLLSREVKQSTDFWAELSPEQQASIDRGLADLAAGRRKPFTDVLARLAQ